MTSNAYQPPDITAAIDEIDEVLEWHGSADSAEWIAAEATEDRADLGLDRGADMYYPSLARRDPQHSRRVSGTEVFLVPRLTIEQQEALLALLYPRIQVAVDAFHRWLAEVMAPAMQRFTAAISETVDALARADWPPAVQLREAQRVAQMNTRERALHARRTRNTGPANPIGLDGRRRR